MIVDLTNFLRRGCHILSVKKLLICRNICHSHEILSNILVDCLSRMSHEHFAFETSFLCKIRKTSAVVNMEMRKQKKINLFGAYHVKVW